MMLRILALATLLIAVSTQLRGDDLYPDAKDGPEKAHDCGFCIGGVDGEIDACDAWQTVSGRTGAGGTGDRDEAFRFFAEAGKTYWFTFCGAGASRTFDTVLSVRDSTCLGTLFACNDDRCGLGSEIAWTAPASGEHVVKVGGYAGATGSYTLAYRAAGVPCEGISVSPSNDLFAQGDIGGPFDPGKVTFTIRNRSNVDSVSYRVSTTANWLSLDDGLGPTGVPIEGTLDPGAQTSVDVIVDADANFLRLGIYEAEILFEADGGVSGIVTRAARLNVFDPTAPQLVVNGDFELGHLGGWRVVNSGSGGIAINNGSFNPPGPDGPFPPCEGRFGVMTWQPGPGRHTLLQDFNLPPGYDVVILSWIDRIRNHNGAFQDPNQEFRVEVRDQDDRVLNQIFSTNPGDKSLNDCTPRSFDLSQFAEQRIKIAFVQEDNLYYFNAHLDDVRLSLGRASIPFEDFEVDRLAIRLDRTEGVGDSHLLGGRFMLGEESDGIDLISESVTLRVGPSTITIPPGSFAQTESSFVWEGQIGDAEVDAAFEDLGHRSYAFLIESGRLVLDGLNNPAAVSLLIGDDEGVDTRKLAGDLARGPAEEPGPPSAETEVDADESLGQPEGKGGVR